jgi:hypothetical protein
MNRAQANRFQATANLEDLPPACLVDDCEARPDRDSPVALCSTHGMAVFASYLGRMPERVSGVRPSTEQPGSHGFVYFFRRGQLIKIGWSANPETRADALRVDAILHVQPGSRQDEAQLHAAFAHLLVPEQGREWFKSEPDLLSFILRLKTQAA